MFRMPLLTALAVVAVLAAAGPPAAADCTCAGGVDDNGNSLDGTACGQDRCGADHQWYRCTTTGWSFVGNGPCSTPTPRCACSNGQSIDGTLIDPEATYCGMQVCGNDNEYYECREDGWNFIGGGPCSGGDSELCDDDLGACACDFGAAYSPGGPVAIPVESTYCGLTICGADNQYYECTQGGWSFLGQGPCASGAAVDADGDTVADGLEQILMERFAPRIRLHLNDLYRPSSVEWYLNRVQMRFDHTGCTDHQVLNKGQVATSTLIATTHPQNGSFCQHSGTQISSGGTSTTGFFLQIPNDADELRTRQGSTPDDWACYAHVFPSEPVGSQPPQSYDIQYWFFYPYNGTWANTPGSAHEGDWEHVTVRVDGATLEPIQMYFAAHDGGNWRPWWQLLCHEGQQPLVYSSVDSHASYATGGSHSPYGDGRHDYGSLLGPVWDCKDRVVNLGELTNPLPGTSWIRYNGRWGEISEPINGSGSPRGPAFNGKWNGDPE